MVEVGHKNEQSAIATTNIVIYDILAEIVDAMGIRSRRGLTAGYRRSLGGPGSTQ